MLKNYLDLLPTDDEPLEPETIRHLGGSSVSSLDVQRLLAIKLIKQSDAPWVDFYVFEDIVHLLNNIEPTVDNVEGAEPHMIWAAIKFMREVRPEMDFETEVEVYIKFFFKDAGLTFLPPYIDLTEQEKAKLKKIEELSLNGPFPLNPDRDDDAMQAIHYLKIQEYLNTWQL